MNKPTVIIGAGLAGLACARDLHQAGRPVRVVEAAEHVGGRVATTERDGFLLDRGFQTMLTSYPHARDMLDFSALDLHGFTHGALIQYGGDRYRFLDPWRNPLGALGSLFAPVASFGDAIRIARLRAACLEDRQGQADDPPTTLELLRQAGLSQRVIDRFFRPFFGGVFLERELDTPPAFFRFVFAMFARGQAVLPRRGMRAIPEQLAATLPDDALLLKSPVASVQPDQVRLRSGRTIEAETVVLAVDPDTAADWTGRPRGRWTAATTLYFAADQSPLGEPTLLLDGTGTGPVNHVCVPSEVCRDYAPPGKSLVSATVLGDPPQPDQDLVRDVRRHLAEWFGPRAHEWSALQVDRIRHALPTGTPRPPADGWISCGDYLVSPSIDGALASGRAAARQVLERQAAAHRI